MLFEVTKAGNQWKKCIVFDFYSCPVSLVIWSCVCVIIHIMQTSKRIDYVDDVISVAKWDTISVCVVSDWMESHHSEI